jgi:hypothetical protein
MKRYTAHVLRAVLSSLGITFGLLAAPAVAQHLPIYGSPGLATGVGGYSIVPGSIDFIDRKIVVNNAGTTVSTVSRHDAVGNIVDRRAVRWSATSAVELDDFGEYEGLAFVTVADINDAGIAVGDSVPGNFEATLGIQWDSSGMTAYRMDPTPGFIDRYVRDINNNGVAVGYGGEGGGGAIRWNTRVSSERLENLPGHHSSAAYAINDAGTVLGVSKWSTEQVAVRWNTDGVISQLGHLGLGPFGVGSAYPKALNSSGTAVGSIERFDASEVYRGTVPVRWDGTETAATELQTLGVNANGEAFGDVYDVNDDGVAVGSSVAPPTSPSDGAVTRAVRWDSNGSAATVLGHLGTAPNGATDSEAFAINSSGLIVGTSSQYNAATETLDPVAVYWRSSGEAVDLNTLVAPGSGWTLTHAYAVSDTRWIAGDGYFDPDGLAGLPAYGRRFLLQLPLPTGGDLDQDGDVDGSDFLTWQRGLGESYNADDLAAWQTNFGSAGDLNVSSTAIPEPPITAWAALGIVLLSTWALPSGPYSSPQRSACPGYAVIA